MVETVTITSSRPDPQSQTDEAARLAVEGSNETSQPNAAQAQPGETQVQEIADQAGLDVEAIENHWLETGQVPEAELAKLSQIGITKEMAEEYISWRHSQAEQGMNDLITQIGGEESFKSMSGWAASNWDSEQLSAYNKAIDSGDRGQIQLALKALKAEYSSANPQPAGKPKLVHAPNHASGGTQAYQSLAEAQRDFANPLYQQDPAFREQVRRRLAVSNIM